MAILMMIIISLTILGMHYIDMKYLKKEEKAPMKDLFNQKKYIQETIHCRLLLSVFKSNEIITIYDFSKYEETNIVSLISSCPSIEEIENFVPYHVIENATIYLLKDGSYIWDFQKS